MEMFDVLFNRMKGIEGWKNLINLNRPFLSSNTISKIENFSHLENLNLLELGDNKLTEIENLNGLTNLECLVLGKNKMIQGYFYINKTFIRVLGLVFMFFDAVFTYKYSLSLSKLFPGEHKGFVSHLGGHAFLLELEQERKLISLAICFEFKVPVFTQG